jgi:VIT1/CCC1 family predicted Fe2+/Mn2+ transporter
MALIPKYYKESHSKAGSKLRDFILGWQDGLVNVLGLVLGIATATQDTKLILISGLIAASAEAISMSAVAYTSTKTEIDFYKSELEREKREVGKMPEIERKEIKDIYLKR